MSNPAFAEVNPTTGAFVSPLTHNLYGAPETGQSLAIGTTAGTAAAGDHLHDARYIRTVNGTGPDAGGNVAVAGGVGSSALVAPTYPVGWYFGTDQFTGVSGGSSQFESNYRGVLPIVVTTTITVDKIGVLVDTADATATVGMALWSSNAEGMPSTLLTSATATPSATGALAATITSTILTPGIYWVGAAASSNATLRMTAVTSSVIGSGNPDQFAVSTNRRWQVNAGTWSAPANISGLAFSGADNTIWVGLRRSA